ncbi:MAG: hypothetical protein H8D23_04560 [Candidatus Brocadiales bacterium]|nr:hypothetical protein [Candidatus Brocadiales bacterium]
MQKFLPSWAEAKDFAEKNKISVNTLKDAYYNDGQVGIQAINNILTALLSITPDKLAAIVNEINNINPVSESLKVWNSIDVPESKKLKYARYAKAISEIENDMNSL